MIERRDVGDFLYYRWCVVCESAAEGALWKECGDARRLDIALTLEECGDE